MQNDQIQDEGGAKRCVIYCRKSSSDGLDRDYTSIDCQTDTCKAYIERHARDGWTFTGKVSAAGGFSGGTTNRRRSSPPCPWTRYGAWVAGCRPSSEPSAS